MITRRGFFGLLSGAMAAEVARKVYVFAPPNGWSFKGGVISPGDALFYLPSDYWVRRCAMPDFQRATYWYAETVGAWGIKG
jgi:hypothetical protein